MGRLTEDVFVFAAILSQRGDQVLISVVVMQQPISPAGQGSV